MCRNASFGVEGGKELAMPDPRPDNVEPTPDLADVPVRDAPAAADDASARRDDPPDQDLTLPTE